METTEVKQQEPPPSSLAGSEQTQRQPEPQPEPTLDVAEPVEPRLDGRASSTSSDGDGDAEGEAENDGAAGAADAAVEEEEEAARSSSPPQHEHGEPYEGMCCMCTMEDITVEDGNYVEFQSHPSMRWKPAMFEKCVVEQLLNEQFFQYVERVKKTDCQAELRRLINAGPPVYVSDKHAFPLDDGDTHVSTLWYADDGEERSARLKGAVEGVEREELLDRLREFIITEGKEPGDDDDEGEEEEGSGNDK